MISLPREFAHTTATSNAWWTITSMQNGEFSLIHVVLSALMSHRMTKLI